MPNPVSHQPRHPGKDDPDDVPDALPVEPDQGPVRDGIPDDAEQYRVVQPAD